MVTVAELKSVYEKYKAASHGEKGELWRQYFKLVAKFCKEKCEQYPRGGPRGKCYRACMKVLLHEGPDAVAKVDAVIAQAVKG